MTLGDRILNHTEQSVDDEFQAATLHKSSTISWYVIVYANMFLGAILAWILPPERNWAAILAIAPVLLGGLVGLAWMKKHTPRPRVAAPGPTEWGLLIIIVALWIGGMYFNEPAANLASATGYITGAIIGGVVGGGAAFWVQKKGRERDQSRLDAEFADD